MELNKEIERAIDLHLEAIKRHAQEAVNAKQEIHYAIVNDSQLDAQIATCLQIALQNTAWNKIDTYLLSDLIAISCYYEIEMVVKLIADIHNNNITLANQLLKSPLDDKRVKVHHYNNLDTPWVMVMLHGDVHIIRRILEHSDNTQDLLDVFSNKEYTRVLFNLKDDVRSLLISSYNQSVISFSTKEQAISKKTLDLISKNNNNITIISKKISQFLSPEENKKQITPNNMDFLLDIKVQFTAIIDALKQEDALWPQALDKECFIRLIALGCYLQDKDALYLLLHTKNVSIPLFCDIVFDIPNCYKLPNNSLNNTFLLAVYNFSYTPLHIICRYGELSDVKNIWESCNTHQKNMLLALRNDHRDGVVFNQDVRNWLDEVNEIGQESHLHTQSLVLSPQLQNSSRALYTASRRFCTSFNQYKCFIAITCAATVLVVIGTSVAAALMMRNHREYESAHIA